MRPFQESDIPAIVEIVRARAAAYNPELLLSVDAVKWRVQGPPGSKPHHAIVVTGPPIDGVPGGALLGAGSYLIEGDEEGHHAYILQLWAHPAAVKLGLEQAIISRLVGILRDIEERSGRSATDVQLFASYSSKVPGRKELYESLGMSLVRRFMRMERPLDKPIDEPSDVPGVTLRTYRRPEDNVGACAAYNNSFSDHWDHHDETQEKWDLGIADVSRRPDLSWLAEIDGNPGHFGGFCICAMYDDVNKEKGVNEGWIELLGTTREWRGKGLGRSLLLHGLHSLKSEGMDTALLGVDSESPTGANLLYEKVGFRVRQREHVYSVRLSDAKA
jgi:mycothiol synthase